MDKQTGISIHWNIQQYKEWTQKKEIKKVSHHTKFYKDTIIKPFLLYILIYCN